MSATATESKKFTGFTGNTAQFTLKGGRYAFLFSATGSGTAVLNVLGPDLATWIPVSSSITATTSSQSLDLPPGQYELVTTGFTACNVSITSCPL